MTVSFIEVSYDIAFEKAVDICKNETNKHILIVANNLSDGDYFLSKLRVRLMKDAPGIHFDGDNLNLYNEDLEIFVEVKMPSSIKNFSSFNRNTSKVVIVFDDVFENSKNYSCVNSFLDMNSYANNVESYVIKRNITHLFGNIKD